MGHSPEQQEKLAHGLSLLERGASYREAARQAGVARATLYRVARNTGTVQADPTERIREKALSLTQKGLERMESEIADTEHRNLAPWTQTAARIGGVLRDPEGDSKRSDMSELVARLVDSGHRVSVAVDPAASQRLAPKAPGPEIGPGEAIGGGEVLEVEAVEIDAPEPPREPE
jgi:hypothetical protein